MVQKMFSEEQSPAFRDSFLVCSVIVQSHGYSVGPFSLLLEDQD